jgi:hypothetical protein
MLCDAEITSENDTQEHLIPRAIGGRRKVNGFICRNCNSSAGETWEAELARQLHPLSLMFNISREGSEPPPLKVTTTAGEHLTVGPGGTLTPTDPKFDSSPVPGGGTNYSLSARSLNEARRMAEGLKRKHPELEVEAILAKAKAVEAYPQGAVHHNLNFGGNLAGRSVIKSCVATAFASGIDWRGCVFALDYLRNESASSSFGFYQERDLVADRVAGMPLHCVAVEANPTSGMILAYAEYFGIHRIVSCLGDGYQGPPIRDAYAIDPRDAKVQKVEVDLTFSEGDIAEIYAYKRVPGEALRAAVSAVIGPVIEGQIAAEQERVTNRAIEEAFASCGAKPGEQLTEEHVRRLATTLAQKMTPFILHRLRPLK